MSYCDQEPSLPAYGFFFSYVAVVADDSIQRAFRLKNIAPTWRLLNAIFAFAGAVVFYFMAITSVRIWAVYALGRDAALQGAGMRFSTILWVPVVMFMSIGSGLAEGQNAIKEWKRRTSDQNVGPTSAAFFIGHCTTAIISLAFFGFMFVTNFYRYIPPQFGGARVRMVQIAVSDKEAQALAELSISANKSIIQGSVELINDTPEALAFRVNGGSTIIVPRQEILALRFK